MPMTGLSQLDSAIVSAYVKATLDVFRIQCQLEISSGYPMTKEELELTGLDVFALGYFRLQERHGLVLLGFNEKICLSIMQHMFKSQLKSIEPKVSQGVLELVSILGARAKMILSERGHEIEEAVPQLVVDGRTMRIGFRKMNNVITVPFYVKKIGEFHLQII